MSNKPTEAQIKEFWEWCGWRHMSGLGLISPDGEDFVPPIDLNNLFRYAPSIIVGITFRYYPGGVECEVTYITEAGFETEKVFIANTKEEGYSESNSRKKSALALFWALWEVKNG